MKSNKEIKNYYVVFENKKLIAIKELKPSPFLFDYTNYEIKKIIECNVDELEILIENEENSSRINKYHRKDILNYLYARIKVCKTNTNNISNEAFNIINDLLKNKKIYKNTTRSGWITSFGNGVISYIEDHKNTLSVVVKHINSRYNLSELIWNIIGINSTSNDKIDDYIFVKDVTNEDYEQPESTLLKIAADKNSFRYLIDKLEVNDDEILDCLEEFYIEKV